MPISVVVFVFSLIFFTAVAIVSRKFTSSTGCKRGPELHYRSPSSSSQMSSSSSTSSQPSPWARPIHQVSRICVCGIAPTASIRWATSHPPKLGLPLVDRDSPKTFSLVYAAIAHEAAPNKLPSLCIGPHSLRKLPSTLLLFNPWNEYATVHILFPPAHIRVRNCPILPKILTCSFTNRID